MTPLFKSMIRTVSVQMTGLAAVFVIACVSPATAHAQEAGSRQIVLDEFTRARPAESSEKAASPSNPKSRTRHPTGNRIAKRPTYHRVGIAISASAIAKQRPAAEELGITLWRLRPSREGDGSVRLLTMENAQSSQWTPERMEADAPLKVGERVRISVESPRVGYLYVVDREQYADGSLGDAYLIFPTTRTRSGNNRVVPGKLIDIPAQEDDPPFFTLVPSANRSDQVAEVLSFIVTTQPLEGLPITDKPLKVSKSDIAKWEKSWSSEVERFEMNGGAGRAWTKEEKAASATSATRLLTQEEPAPQTVYRMVAKTGSLLVTVPLRYGK
jgi:hypothetical protein